MKRFFEFFFEKILLICGSITGLVVLLIIVFLFKEGSGIFSRNVVEDDYVLLINSKNTIKGLSSKEIKEIFDHNISNWKQVGGNDMEILPFRINDISNYCTEEEIGSEMQYVPQCINKIIAQQDGIIVYVPKEYITNECKGTILDAGTISFTQFFGGKEWIPTATPTAQYGIFPLIMGTLWVSLAAILLALPFGLGVAIYLSELANEKFRNIFKPVIELLAAIPSVVYGFFGLVVVVPFIQKIFDLPVGETGLSGAVILAIMTLPTIITIAEDAMRNTPRAMKEASLALGATQWQTIYKVIIPYSASGITAAGVLGIGRAIGETMAVLMVTGNAAVMPHSLLEPLRTIPATIAAELGESPKGGTHYQALFALGAILFLITLLINAIVELVKSKKIS